MKKIIIVFIVFFNFLFSQNSDLKNLDTNSINLDREFLKKTFIYKRYALLLYWRLLFSR